MAAKKALGELLVRENVIDIKQLEHAKRKQKESGGRLTSALVELGYIKETELADFLGEQYGVPTIDLSAFECDQEAIKTLPRNICSKHCIIPVSKVDKTLVVAFADPTNIYVKDDIALLTRCKVEVVVASEIAIKKAIDKYYGEEHSTAGFGNLMNEMTADDFSVEAGGNEAEVIGGEIDADAVPLVKFVNAMLAEAIKLGASDIHVEPYENRLRVRFRIDGVLMEKTQPPKEAAAGISTRIKVMSKMDIAERRKPQDGRLKVRLKGKMDVDFRVSSLPTLFGEKIVLRILDKSNLQVDMEKLGFEKEQLKILKEAIRQPQGMVLITGPTGSGKTTTIYSCLADLNTPEKNLSTAEDPVEFNLDGINQVQVNPDIGFNFSDALKSFLRQDPDIIMVGEIRDLDTAQVAYKAASTGHLVVSTLHTNDAASTVARLMDMGVPGFLIAESTSLVVAQRLMRRICIACKTPIKVANDVLLELGVSESDLPHYNELYKGEGCADCNNTGLKGRVAVHELLLMKANVRKAIFEGASPLELKRQAIKDGMKTLRQSALMKLQKGLTTVDEVLNATVGDDL